MKKNTVVGNLDIIDLTDNNFTNIAQRTRKVRIWTPKYYNENSDLKYPVVYFHDGQNIFDNATSYSGEWEADETMTSLIEKGFKGAILVGIDNTLERLGEYTYKLDFLDTFYELDENTHDFSREMNRLSFFKKSQVNTRVQNV
ncbi:MAG TPA: alpha/beta hydrolase-fold protein [Bacilli bacterium]|nr:alpha/beta hydrolase-fold protein [Bacilli bacterium]